MDEKADEDAPDIVSSDRISDVSERAVKLLCDGWYLKSGFFNLHLFSVGRFRGSELWQTALSIETLINYMDYVAQSKEYMFVIRLTFSQHSANQIIAAANGSIDDVGWWGLAYLRAYEFTEDEKYRDSALEILQYMMSKGWTEDLNGGLLWDIKKDYKNAITNELGLMLSAKLCSLTEDGTEERNFCFETMIKIWKWFRCSGMINQDNLINDGLTSGGENNRQTTWTYNQGVILGGLGYLYKVTGDEDVLSEAHSLIISVMEHLCSEDNILQEPCEVPSNRLKTCNQDQMCFKGIFMRYLMYFLQQLPEHSRTDSVYEMFVIQNCVSLLENAVTEHAPFKFGSRWTGPFDKSNAAIQTSAIDLLNSTFYILQRSGQEKELE